MMEAARMSMINRIVLPVDFSNNSEAVIPLALDLAERYSAEVHLIHVLNFPRELKRGESLTSEGSALIDDFRKAAEAEMHEYYDRNFESHPNVKSKIGEALGPIWACSRFSAQSSLPLLMVSMIGCIASSSAVCISGSIWVSGR